MKLTTKPAPFVRQSINSSDNAATSDSLYAELYENAVPSYVENELHVLYGSVYSSMPHPRVYGGLKNASTFRLSKNQEAIAIFLFRVEGKVVRVLNEGMEVDEETVIQFARHIFTHYASCDLIRFTGVAHAFAHLDLPFSQSFCTDDSVICLPRSAEEYLNSLGKATRKNIKQYLNRIKRDYPSFDFQVHDGRTVDEAIARKIISFNRVRFQKKGRVSAISPEEESRIFQMTRECGIVGTITIDGELCAGSLVYCVGEHYHSWLKAHDPTYDDYRLGLIGSFLMISACIHRGGKAFHLMWGREPHKALLNSELKTFSNLTVYRNHAATLRNCGVLFRQLYQHNLRQGKLWLLNMERNSGRVTFPLKAGLNGARKVKRWLPRQH